MPIEQSVPEAVDSLNLLPMITDSTLRRAKFREVVGFEFWLVHVGNDISAVTF